MTALVVLSIIAEIFNIRFVKNTYLVEQLGPKEIFKRGLPKGAPYFLIGILNLIYLIFGVALLFSAIPVHLAAGIIIVGLSVLQILVRTENQKLYTIMHVVDSVICIIALLACVII